jgi:CRISP-associated protein Cas1
VAPDPLLTDATAAPGVSGNTHYPADRREWRFFNGALDIPPAFVVIDGSGDITLEAIDWLATQRVPLIRLRWNGQFASIITTGGQAAAASKVYWQQQTRDNPRERLAFAADIIRQKAHNSLVTMEKYLPPSPTRDRAAQNIATRAKWLEDKPPRTITSLLGIEGVIASDYFRTWSDIPIKWSGVKRHPVPKDWSTYTARTPLRKAKGHSRGATHPVSAMLNYAYGVLVARTQIRLIADGYDPTLGILHDKVLDRGTYPAFALDHMEPMRPLVDQAVLDLISSATFTGADFPIRHDGVCRLNPELARRVAQLALQRCEIPVIRAKGRHSRKPLAPKAEADAESVPVPDIYQSESTQAIV